MSPTHADPEHAGSIHHLELATDDLGTAVPFWEWFLGELGYDRKDDWEDGRSWTCGTTYVVVKRASDGEHPFERGTPGLDHVAFHAESRRRVDEITAGVRDRNDAELLFPDRHPYAGGYYALYCEGPDGVKLEVVGPDREDD
ncbi:VOC family protein [Halobaculum sp. MBLA0147]|uniref:VOC family protein n=1 Tax=Halobaculum sp. MBLA0147 TaxID=3079934 RepID=UPI003526A636